MITSRDNAQVKNVCRLCDSKSERRKQGLMVLEGERLLCEARHIEKLYYTADSNYQRFLPVCSGYEEVSPEVFKKMCDTVSPQGVLGLVKLPELSPKIDSKGKYLAFENLQDPSNLGAAARTAEAFGISGIIVSGTDPYAPKVLRASMGAILRIPVTVCDDILEFLPTLPHRKIGTVCRGGKDIRSFEFKNDIVIIGNEGNGLTPCAQEMCDHLITIQMTGNAESLNASVASAITVWEMTKNG
ncbi:MAG: RNA methyltransferase [Oscillospiraceae bacterium]|nr:RNA methyltransferase [Candidatus Equicaccousia limihippi]